MRSHESKKQKYISTKSESLHYFTRFFLRCRFIFLSILGMGKCDISPLMTSSHCVVNWDSKLKIIIRVGVVFSILTKKTMHI